MTLEGEAKREYQRRWMRNRRNEWIAQQGGVCVQCGTSENLEVDHIDPATKTMQPSHIWSRRESVRALELSKCQVLCSDCHLEKTRRMYPEPEHGTLSRYKGRYQCRCAECRRASADYHREKRRKLKVQ